MYFLRLLPILFFLLVSAILFFFLDKFKFFGNLTYLDLLKFIVAILFFLLAISIVFKFKKFFFININYFLSLKFVFLVLIIFMIFQFFRMNLLNCEMLSLEQQCVCYDLHYNYYSTEIYKEKYIESCEPFRVIDEFKD